MSFSQTQCSTALNRAGSEPAAGFIGLLGFVAGATLPLVAVTLLPIAWPRIARLRGAPWIGLVGLGMGSLMAAGLVAGLYDEAISRLVSLSLGG